MERLNIILDEETSNLLRGKKNKSRYIREAIKVYNQCVTLDSMTTLKQVLLVQRDLLKEIDSKIDYMASNYLAGTPQNISPPQNKTVHEIKIPDEVNEAFKL